jgi:hypothetical protein
MTLSETATIWTSAGALIGGVVVWGAFVMERRKGHDAISNGVRNTIHGLRAELELSRGWATGGENGLGYPRQGDEQASRRYYWTHEKSWRKPQRFILPLALPTIDSLSRSRYLGRMKGLIRPFVTLRFALHALFALHQEYRQIVLAQSGMYAALVKANLDADPSKLYRIRDEVHAYVRLVFEYNYQIHVHRVGGALSDNPGCLYIAYDAATKALNDFERRWRPPREHWVYPIGHFLAVIAFAAGLLLVILWFASVVGPADQPLLERLLSRSPLS